VISASDDLQPLLLSQTGCVDMTDPKKPVAGAIPYGVQSALWSDGATKERFMVIPAGQKIHVLDCAVELDACKPPGQGGVGSDDGHFDMPVGTVLIKNFSIDGKHIETRLFMRRTAQVWKGFSYEWNEALSDATLISDSEFPMGKDKPVGTADQVWHYPSRSQCLECHTKYAGRSLGPTTAQLNGDYTYPDGTTANQMTKLKELGIFDAAPKDIPGLPDFTGQAATLEERARSYLQTNCAICHRPGGEFSSIDMRYVTPFANTNLCGASERDAGSVPAQRLVPGNPTMSALSMRMHTLADVQRPDGSVSTLRMPKIGSKVVDPVGTKLIDDWITALPADTCPPPP
jgi:uncharacterized repeat protein (TIGR03806 family)